MQGVIRVHDPNDGLAGGTMLRRYLSDVQECSVLLNSDSVGWQLYPSRLCWFCLDYVALARALFRAFNSCAHNVL